MTTENDPSPAPDANGAPEPTSPLASPAPPLDPLAEAEQKVVALKDQLLRTAADFDNYRKRTRREVDDALGVGKESMLKDLLPVFDNLERAVLHVDAAADLKSFASGVQMVLKQFADTLKRVGIERVTTQGSPFDPSVHEAIQQLETDEYAPGVVAAEVQGGYRYSGRLLRPALVVVAKAKPVMN